MKSTVLTMALFMAAYLCNGRSKLPLEITEKFNHELSNTDHCYLIEVKNSSNKTINAYVQKIIERSKNLDSRQLQTELDFKIFTESKQLVLKTLFIKPNITSRFYVKSNHNSNTELGRWNCVEIELVNEFNQNVIS